ncbi:MAG: hypothetical protein D8H99_44595 [Streptococcus sp.]|nr:MAG: hypothetical protein D8H99_44595 [Streptococcus sp.]
MEKEELLKHYRHSLEVYQDRLANSEEDKFYTRVHGYRSAAHRKELLVMKINEIKKKIKELEDGIRTS